MSAPVYSLSYWQLLAAGYEKMGKPVPADVKLGLAAAEEAALAAATAWMVADDAGREIARLIWSESGYKPWRQKILGASIQALTIFKHGASIVPYQLGNRAVMGQYYLEVKADLDRMWTQYVNEHRHTKTYQQQLEWMFKYGLGNHHYPADIDKQFCENQGWTWTPTMGIGTGTKVHLRADEVPANALVKVTGVLLAVVNGLLYVPNQEWIDLDVTRGGTRAVYGWWTKD